MHLNSQPRQHKLNIYWNWTWSQGFWFYSTKSEAPDFLNYLCNTSKFITVYKKTDGWVSSPASCYSVLKLMTEKWATKLSVDLKCSYKQFRMWNRIKSHFLPGRPTLKVWIRILWLQQSKPSAAALPTSVKWGTPVWTAWCSCCPTVTVRRFTCCSERHEDF